MLVLKKAIAGDFEKIYPLLLELNNKELTKEDWRQLFINHCGGPEDYFGFAFFDQNEAVGFLGLIFSARLKDAEMRKFCNMTSWIIKKEYRRKGLGRQLLLEVLKLKDYTVTDLTASENTIRMLREYGFKELETNFDIIFPMPTIKALFDKCSVLLNHDIIKNYLGGRDLKIYNDHAACKCVYILIKREYEYCYIIVTITKRRHLPFAQIHYMSNVDVFLKYIDHVRLKICLHLKVFGLIADKRFLKGGKVRYLVTRQLPQSKFFHSDLFDKDGITDNLYTELLILNS